MSGSNFVAVFYMWLTITDISEKIVFMQD